MNDLATKVADNEIYDYKNKTKTHMEICLTTVTFGLLFLSTVMPMSTLIGLKHAGNGLNW
ncbi:MAG TPA: hypothetical protein VEQ18_05390 [Candidatus Nitrosocosmicus sp.]|nr:hypothetical protein [Candidatus Nitrosocosmicus sp.]